MSRTRTLLRRIAALCLLLYVGGVVVVPVVHAAEAGTRRVETHVHASDAACPAAHDELHCPSCHFAFGVAAEVTPHAALVAAPAPTAPVAPEPGLSAGTLARFFPDARAPPRAA